MSINTNLVHNILNVALAVVAVLSLPEVTRFIPPEYAVFVAGAVGAAKLIINIIRDGIDGLIKEQPPVK
jgi:hypothetical protein